MGLRYINEHLICKNYEKGNKAVFEKITLREGLTFNKELAEAEILFVTKGEFKITFNNISRTVTKGTIILFLPVQRFTIDPLEDVDILTFRIKGPIYLCNIEPLEKLMSEGQNQEIKEFLFLKYNKRIEQYIELLSNCLDDGLSCKCLAEIKSKEVFYYFRAYYSKEELKTFFAPLFTKDYEFTVFVLQNFKEMKTVQQFAESYGYSLSKFEREFKKIFNVPAYQWMIQQKSNLIYNELVYTNRTLLDIADEYDFSSLSQFCDFCKRFLGTTPGKIRNLKKCPNTFTEYMNK